MTTNDPIVAVSDPAFSSASMPIAVDTSSQGRFSGVIPPTTRSVGTPSDPIQSSGMTTFLVDCNNTRPLKFSNLALRIRGRFVSKTNVAASAPFPAADLGSNDKLVAGTRAPDNAKSMAQSDAYGVPFDSVAFDGLSRLISVASLSVNNTPITTVGNANTFSHTFLSNLLLNHTAEELEAHPALFQPCFDSKYVAASNRYNNSTATPAQIIAETDDTAAEETGLKYLTRSIPLGGCSCGMMTTDDTGTAIACKTFMPYRPMMADTNDYGAIITRRDMLSGKAMFAAAAPADVGKLTTTFNKGLNATLAEVKMVEHANLMTSPEARDRARRWIGHRSMNRDVTRYIPLADMFNIRTDDVLTNMRTMNISIQWNANGDAMLHHSQLENTHAKFVILGVDLVSDGWVAAYSAVAESSAAKISGGITKIYLEEPSAQALTYTPGSSLSLVGKTNASKVLLMCDNNVLNSATNGLSIALSHNDSAATAATNVGSTLMKYQNGLSFLGGLEATAPIPTADRLHYPWSMQTYDSERSTDDAAPCSSVDVSYDGISYPSQPITTAWESKHFDPMGLYYEYKKACRDPSRPGITLKHFASTMPFLCLSFAQENDDRAIQLKRDGGSIIIRANGGAVNPSGAPIQVVAITYRHRIYEISPQGDVRNIL